MPEWLYEAGIGENRAALVEDREIVEAAIELHGAGPLVGTVARARLIDRSGLARLDDGTEAVLDRAPSGVTAGGALTLRITREPIEEPGGRHKPARAIVTDEALHEGPDLLTRLRSGQTQSSSPAKDATWPVRVLPAHGPDLLEQAGWSELLEEARTGDIAFDGGALRMWPTPAMTLFDVDGGGDLATLAIRAAAAVARAVRRHAIGGSIGIDFPTVTGKAARLAVAQVLDADLPQPFERTAMNGFGFLQIVRPRPRASLPERLRADRAGAEARMLLRRLEREPPGPVRSHRVPPAVLARLRPEWLTELARRTGVEPRLEPAR